MDRLDAGQPLEAVDGVPSHHGGYLAFLVSFL
jgi:hypothetical protein